MSVGKHSPKLNKITPHTDLRSLKIDQALFSWFFLIKLDCDISQNYITRIGFDVAETLYTNDAISKTSF